MYCSDSSARQIWVSNTKWCHKWLATFHIYRHKHFSVYHIRRGMLPPKSVYPGLFHPVGFSGVWARTPSLFMVLCYAGYYPHCIIVRKLGFWGPWHFKTRIVAPRQLPSYFQENLRSAPPPHLRWQHRSRLFSLTKLDTTTSLI